MSSKVSVVGTAKSTGWRWADELTAILLLGSCLAGFAALVLDAIYALRTGGFVMASPYSLPAMEWLVVAGLALSLIALIGYPGLARFRVAVMLLVVGFGWAKLDWLVPFAMANLFGVVWPHHVCLAAAVGAYVAYSRPTGWRAVIVALLLFFGWTNALIYLRTLLIS